MHFYKLVLLLPFILLLGSAQSTYYVTPTPDTPCPGDPCLSFVEHTRQGGGHLDNATLVFLPGTHTIESSIKIGNLTSLTLLGDPSSLPNITSRIVCSQPASVVFQCIESLFISALDIVSCGSDNNASMYGYGFGYDYGSGGVVMENLCGSEFYFQGAAVAAKLVRNLTISKCRFLNNTNYIKFSNNQASYKGGGIYITNSVANFAENEFKNNQAYYHGGGVYIQNSVANFTKNEFNNNLAFNESGAGIYITNSVANFAENEFKNNLAIGSNGGGVCIEDSDAKFTVNAFINNSAMNGGGGAMFIGDSTVHFSGKTNFTTNSGQLFGGAIAIVNSRMSCHGDTTFVNNTANSGGGIWVTDSYLTFAQNTTFQNNSAVNGGAVYAISSNLTICEKMMFIMNSATYGGAVYGVQCHFNFEGENIFIRNTASRDGGGLLLTSDSKCYLLPNTTVFFTFNTAMQNGGAIKVDVSNQLVYCLETSLTSALNECFFQLNSKAIIEHDRQLNNFNIRMDFSNNTAVEGGSDIYGGAVDNCGLQNGEYNDFESSGSVLNSITGNSPEALYVSSDPLRICICENNVVNCSSSSITRCAYPGGKFNISVIALGQRDGRVSAVIEADLTQHNIRFDSSQDIQNINNTCTNIEYTVFSSEEQTQEDVILHAEGPCPPEGRSLELKVEVLQCPHGFQLSSDRPMCVCSDRLEEFTDTCAIENGTILRPRGALFWVGYNNESDELIFHPQCPFDYCTSEELYVSVDSSDTQCNYNRTGILCGECIQDLSLMLGSSRCQQCSADPHLALLIAFAFAGIALVLFLFLLKLTVAVGTINGLIFYANVVQVNSAVFFQPGTTNILTVFIAWLNLDLGIETCFYDGMDAYANTWLQFVFPVYVLTLVGIIILFSHFSQTISSLLGTNPIAVLCTLYLLSYGKVLRTIIAAMSYTSLEYPNGGIENVWRQDGNVTYLEPRHIPLFLVALCSLFLFLPYSLLLFCGQWLQGMPNSRVFSWINKPTLKSILDAYHAPYVGKHRYWTGLLLLIRSSLFVIYAFNALRDPDLNLFCITTSTLALITIGFVAEKIYANRYLGALEASFIINLSILAAATIAFGRLRAVTYTSVSIAFVTFIEIVVYHSYLQIKDYKLLQKIATLALAIFHQKKKCKLNAEDIDKELTTSTQSVVSLREPLLEDEL